MPTVCFFTAQGLAVRKLRSICGTSGSGPLAKVWGHLETKCKGRALLKCKDIIICYRKTWCKKWKGSNLWYPIYPCIHLSSLILSHLRVSSNQVNTTMQDRGFLFLQHINSGFHVSSMNLTNYPFSVGPHCFFSIWHTSPPPSLKHVAFCSVVLLFAMLLCEPMASFLAGILLYFIIFFWQICCRWIMVKC